MTPIKVNVHRCYCCSIYFTVTVGFSIKCNSYPIMSVTRPLASCWGIILVFPCVNCQVIADERERDVYLSNRLINWICIFTSGAGNVLPFRSTWAQSLDFCALFCMPLFVALSLFLWPIYCLSLDLPLLITPLASLNCPYST